MTLQLMMNYFIVFLDVISLENGNNPLPLVMELCKDQGQL